MGDRDEAPNYIGRCGGHGLGLGLMRGSATKQADERTCHTQLTGSLASDGAGCIIVRAKDSETTTLVFPEGTSFKDESLLLPDGSSLSDGDSVALQGARVPANENLSMCLNYFRLFSVEKASISP